jgi:pilus assembly protein CpaC
MLEAADKLDAAGMRELARTVRQEAEIARDELLSQKLAELERLKAEINALKRRPKAQDQVLVKVQVLELSLSKLRLLGFDLAALDRESQGALADLLGPASSNGNRRESFHLQNVDAKTVIGLMQALKQEKLVKVLAEPSLVTVDGRPASYLVGGEVGVPAAPKSGRPSAREFRNIGTQIDFLPTLLGDDKLKFEIRARVSQLDPALDRVVNGETYPGVRSVEVDTGLSMSFGQTAVIAGLVQQRAAKGDGESNEEAAHHELVETIFLVTPELVEGPDTAEVPPRRHSR